MDLHAAVSLGRVGPSLHFRYHSTFNSRTCNAQTGNQFLTLTIDRYDDEIELDQRRAGDAIKRGDASIMLVAGAKKVFSFE